MREAETFGPSVAEAIAAPGPSLVEIDMRSIGDMPAYFPYGPKVASTGPAPAGSV